MLLYEHICRTCKEECGRALSVSNYDFQIPFRQMQEAALDKWPLGEHFLVPRDGVTRRHTTLHQYREPAD